MTSPVLLLQSVGMSCRCAPVFDIGQFCGILLRFVCPSILRFAVEFLHPRLFPRIHFRVLLSNILTICPAHCNLFNTLARYQVSALYNLYIPWIRHFGLYRLQSASLWCPPFRTGEPQTICPHDTRLYPDFVEERAERMAGYFCHVIALIVEDMRQSNRLLLVLVKNVNFVITM
jgi:hypothetical protein